ncbi:hypothetical protein N0V87_000111 [Didymella glomerata]|uniref:Uncharacterized protein n=1 Tax=Didymella glomerata TaxID=749621 RepID=A0A9W9C414_9PLEO|nr:hypothetical protein N0V87_000111 [Didymella glomerata]
MDTAERTERTPILLAQEPMPKPDGIERAPTVASFQEPVPLVRRDAETTPAESPKIGRQKTRFFPELEEHPSQSLTSPSSPVERDRKASTAAPSVFAPRPQRFQQDRKPTEIERKLRKKMPNYPPEQQYPPAPAYPVRDTPAWTKPDTYTPPPKPKPEPTPKKRGFFGLGPKPRDESQPVQRSAPEPRTAETTIHKPNMHQSDETSKRHREVGQSEETIVRNPPILQPQPVEITSRAIRSQPEPGRMSPIVTRLASHPFVAKRRSPLAINLQGNKTFVTKRSPLLSLKRLHLNVGRRLTKNPLARAQYRERRLSQGLSAGTPAVTPQRKGLCFRKRRRTGQETGERQKRSLKSLGLRRKRIRRAEYQEANQLVQQPQNKMAIADRRELPRLLLNGRRSKRQHQGGSRQGGLMIDALQSQKQRQARRKLMAHHLAQEHTRALSLETWNGSPRAGWRIRVAIKSGSEW